MARQREITRNFFNRVERTNPLFRRVVRRSRRMLEDKGPQKRELVGSPVHLNTLAAEVERAMAAANEQASAISSDTPLRARLAV